MAGKNAWGVTWLFLQAGFLSSGQKQSIFAVPDNPEGKVGVVGSGKGMTDYSNTGRHDFNA